MGEPDWDGIADYLDAHFDAANGDCFWCDLVGNGSAVDDESRLRMVEDYWPLLEGSPFVDELRRWKSRA
jgi:hypothetical protein